MNDFLFQFAYVSRYFWILGKHFSTQCFPFENVSGEKRIVSFHPRNRVVFNSQATGILNISDCRYFLINGSLLLRNVYDILMDQVKCYVLFCL